MYQRNFVSINIPLFVRKGLPVRQNVLFNVTVFSSSGLSVLWNFDQVAQKVAFTFLLQFALLRHFCLIIFLNLVALRRSLLVSKFNIDTRLQDSHAVWNGVILFVILVNG